MSAASDSTFRSEWSPSTKTRRDGPGDGSRLLFQLGGGTERVPPTGNEQARDMQVGEMGGPEPVRTPGWVERIADQDQSGHLEAFGHRHGAHPAAHGAAPDGHAAGRNLKSIGQFRRRGADCLDAHFGWIRSALPGGPTRKLDSLDHYAEPGNCHVDRHQPGLVPSGAGAGREQESQRGPIWSSHHDGLSPPPVTLTRSADCRRFGLPLLEDILAAPERFWRGGEVEEEVAEFNHLPG